MRIALKFLRLAVLLGAGAATALLGVRAWMAFVSAPLAPWLVWAPEEPPAAVVETMNWDDWLAAEDVVFDDLGATLTAPLGPDHRAPMSRYNEASPTWPGGFAQDYNRSFAVLPEGPPRGAVVLLHGLTDAPYSLRHVARLYAARGWVVVAPRMPGHGTTPAGLVEARWPDWMAATRMAARAAAAEAPGLPLHMVGYSNGGALAVKYALDALEDDSLPAPARLTLISPMIGVTAFARFAGLAGWPALLPGFDRAAWLDVLPEFNPFKYNSFPVNAAVQSDRLTRAVQRGLRRAERAGLLAGMAPVLTFQSVVDGTVSTPAVLTELYGRLPRNGSALVLFDVNHASPARSLLNPGAADATHAATPPAPRAWDLLVVGPAGPDDAAAVARVTPAGATAATVAALGVDYPGAIVSLGHVALPFPPEDGLYGFDPDPLDDFGVRLGAVALRGEPAALVAPPGLLLRITANPFHAWTMTTLDRFALR